MLFCAILFYIVLCYSIFWSNFVILCYFMITFFNSILFYDQILWFYAILWSHSLILFYFMIKFCDSMLFYDSPQGFFDSFMFWTSYPHSPSDSINLVISINSLSLLFFFTIPPKSLYPSSINSFYSTFYLVSCVIFSLFWRSEERSPLPGEWKEEQSGCYRYVQLWWQQGC